MPGPPRETTDEHPIVALIFELKDEIKAVRAQLDEIQDWVDQRTEQEERAALEAELREKWEAEKQESEEDEPIPARSSDAAARVLAGLVRKWWHVIVVGTGGTGIAAAIGLSGGEDGVHRHRAKPVRGHTIYQAAPHEAGKENNLVDPARGAGGHAIKPVHPAGHAPQNKKRGVGGRK